MDPTQNHNNGAPTTVVVLDLVLSFSPMVSVLILSFFFVESANGSFEDMGENKEIESLMVNLHKSKTNDKKEKRH